MSGPDDPSCGCPQAAHPPRPGIPAGLDSLTGRQGSGFPEYRAAMLAALPAHAALAGWRARSAGDLGVMLLEAWAYVLDSTGFYDARIAERSYLPTAPDEIAARRLTDLIGHRPRPAMAARVRLALRAEGTDPVTLPKGTGFRSGPFDSEPPQVFELPAETVIWPRRNSWKVAPIRADDFDGVLRFLPGRAPSAGALLRIGGGSLVAAARVEAMSSEAAADGNSYQRATLSAAGSAALAPLVGQPRSALSVEILRLPLAESGFATRATTSGDIDSLTLDAVYPQVRADSPAILELGAALHAVTITTTSVETLTIDRATGAKAFGTKATFAPAIARPAGAAATLHVNPFPLGAPTRPAKTAITGDDLTAGMPLVSPVASLSGAPASGQAVLVGAGKQGALTPGSLVELGDGAARFQPDASAAPIDPPLLAPLTLHGNVVEAVRGETVVDEALGSGDAAKPFNSFTLKKSPLAWVEDASQPGGRRPEVSIRVDQFEWQRVDSFFGHGPDERIYTVRAEPDGHTRITFGDGRRGARVPSGVSNVRATYRFGAGAAKPPPGAINQIAVPIRGLVQVRGPLPATGGADPEAAGELRRSAPAGTLTLGRAVSLADFAALARSFPGVLNAAAAWAWDERRQRAAAKLWIVPDGGDPSAALQPWLAGQASTDLVIVVAIAGRASFTSLSITLEFAAGHDPTLVAAAARAALFDPIQGLLAPRNQAIGAALFRSALTHRLHQVPGVASVVSILLDGSAMPDAVGPGQGNWFDLEAGTAVR